MACSEEKRILVVTQHYWPESFRITDICAGFLENDCSVDVLCGIPNYPKGSFYPGYGIFKQRRQIHDGVNIRRTFEIARGDNSNLRIFLNYITFPLAGLFHIPRLMFRKYDAIFMYQTSPVMMALPGILLGKIKHIPTTMMVLDMWPENLYSVLNIGNKALRALLKRVSHWHYKKSDRLIGISDSMSDILLDITGKPRDRIKTIVHFCEEFYEQDIFDEELSAKFPPGLNMVFAGNLSPAQSFETVLDAAQALQDEGLAINWIIVGDGMSKDWLVDEVKKRGLNNWFFEGSLPPTEIPRYHTLADGLFACLSASEMLDITIPAKVLSYFAAGRPMVLAMNGEAQRIVRQAGCGFADDAGDSAALAGNIRRLANMTPEQRSILGQKARNYHRQHFKRSICLQQMLEFTFASTDNPFTIDDPAPKI